MKALLIALSSIFPCTTWALDCSSPAPAVEVRLYVGSEYDPEDQIVPGQELPTITTCAIGRVSDAVSEKQWLEVDSAWVPYEVMMIDSIEPPAILTLTTPELRAESFNIGKIAFVKLGRNFHDTTEAAISVAEIIAFAERKESTGGNGTVIRYDYWQAWTPNVVSERLVLVYDDGQIISAKVDAWRDSCRSQTFTMYQLDQGLYPDFQLAVEGMSGICSVTLRELAPAQPR